MLISQRPLPVRYVVQRLAGFLKELFGLLELLLTLVPLLTRFTQCRVAFDEKGFHLEYWNSNIFFTNSLHFYLHWKQSKALCSLTTNERNSSYLTHTENSLWFKKRLHRKTKNSETVTEWTQEIRYIWAPQVMVNILGSCQVYLLFQQCDIFPEIPTYVYA